LEGGPSAVAKISHALSALVGLPALLFRLENPSGPGERVGVADAVVGFSML